jgi:hypothetical protein
MTPHVNSYAATTIDWIEDLYGPRLFTTAFLNQTKIEFESFRMIDTKNSHHGKCIVGCHLTLLIFLLPNVDWLIHSSPPPLILPLNDHVSVAGAVVILLASILINHLRVCL